MRVSLLAAAAAGLAVLVAVPAAPALTRRGPVPLPAPQPGMGEGAGRTVLPDSAGVAGLADRLAALSRAGLPPAETWRVLATRQDAAAPICRAVARTVALGGTSAEGLRLATRGEAGSRGVRGGPVDWLALAFAVSQECGAPLADVLDGVARTVREEHQAVRERDAALAGPRTTAVVLTWLPLAGLGLGALTGTNSVWVLVSTGPGLVCLATGAALWWAGRWWMARLLRRAERQGG